MNNYRSTAMILGILYVIGAGRAERPPAVGRPDRHLRAGPNDLVRLAGRRAASWQCEG